MTTTKYRENKVHVDMNRARLLWDCGVGHVTAPGKEVWSIDRLEVFSNLEDNCAAAIRMYQGKCQC
jgi:hypothetical protein